MMGEAFIHKASFKSRIAQEMARLSTDAKLGEIDIYVQLNEFIMKELESPVVTEQPLPVVDQDPVRNLEYWRQELDRIRGLRGKCCTYGDIYFTECPFVVANRARIAAALAPTP